MPMWWFTELLFVFCGVPFIKCFLMLVHEETPPPLPSPVNEYWLGTALVLVNNCCCNEDIYRDSWILDKWSKITSCCRNVSMDTRKYIFPLKGCFRVNYWNRYKLSTLTSLPSHRTPKPVYAFTIYDMYGK